MSKINLDGGMSVERITDKDNDLKIVNAARVSMGKRATEFVLDGTEEHEKRRAATGMGADDRLLKYLAKHNHWTPFAHCRVAMQFTVTWPKFSWLLSGDHADGATVLAASRDKDSRITFDWVDSVYGLLTRVDWMRDLAAPHLAADFPHTLAAFGVKPGEPRHREGTPIPFMHMPQQEPITLHIKVPVFVARQMMRSNYGIVYNEVSRRYVSDEPEYFAPSKWRMRPSGSIKQGSGDAASESTTAFCDAHEQASRWSGDASYRAMVAAGIAPEQARMVLPQSTMVEFWMTASRARLRKFVELRTGDHVQQETRLVAEAIGDMVRGGDV